MLITIGATVVLVVGFHWGAVGLVVGNFTGTLTVYFVLARLPHASSSGSSSTASCSGR